MLIQATVVTVAMTPMKTISNQRARLLGSTGLVIYAVFQ